LRANAAQFGLLMLINAFVGGMVGLERTVMPLIGTEEFGLLLNTAAVSFIISFGLVKAVINLLSGALADRFGRKRILVVGWLFGVPVPFFIIFAPSWSWIVAANVFLGINQGLTWSMAVVMKVDLVGPRSRGLAVGLNEFAGYFAVGLTALATGYLASVYGLRPEPFYLGIGYAVLGLLLSWLVVRDTRAYVALAQGRTTAQVEAPVSFRSIFARTTWGDRSLFAASQAGLVNNLNDGMSWGILPLFFVAHGLNVADVGLLKFVYPAVWGIGQLVTGPLSDKLGRKQLIAPGMAMQAAGLGLTIATTSFALWLTGSILLGIGTAMVYPALIAVVSDAAAPVWRARALGVYRFWRDLGYAVGALLAGMLADIFGYTWAIGAVAALTLVSGIVVALTMCEARVQTKEEAGNVTNHTEETNPPPIIADKHYEAPSVFTVENLLREARRQKQLSAGQVPSICVLDPDGDVLEYVQTTQQATQHATWACYHTQLYTFEHEGHAYGIIGRAVGASFAVLVAEELFASGCRLLISITSAGQITGVGQPPYFVLIERALRDEGTSYHYLPPSRYSVLHGDLRNHLQATWNHERLRLYGGASWTTDAPFRETEAMIAVCREEGILTVEMEAAALYALAEAKHYPIVCFAHVTNQMAQGGDDFEKGIAQGSVAALELIAQTAEHWLRRHAP
jgi:MFS family permease